MNHIRPFFSSLFIDIKKIKFPIDVYSNSNIIIEFEKFMGIPEYDKIKDFELKKSPMEFKIFVSHTYGKIEEKKLIN